MNKSVLISIQSYWVFLIIARIMGWDIPQEKTVEVRKDFPNAHDWNNLVHIYCSKNRKSFNRIPKEYQPLMEKFLGKVIGEFVCDRIEKLRYNCDGYGHEWHEWNDEYVDYANMCLSEKELEDYLGTSNGYGWHISDLKIYDTPKELREFRKPDIPYHAIEEQNGNLIFYDGWTAGRPITRPPQNWCYVEELIE